MSKHTPGPWVWGDWTILDEDRPAQRRGEPYWTLVEGSGTLCRGPIGRKSMDTESIVWPLGYEVDGIGANDPDMALIAAAPKLLEACKAAEEWLSGWASAEPYIEVIRAAIREAEGLADGGEQGTAKP